jgi:hypothetical protein
VNVQKPDQPGPCGSEGSGGTSPVLSPAVCVHDAGCRSLPVKSTLWKLLPSGYENVTLLPAVIVTAAPPPAGFWNALSTTVIAPSASGALEGAEPCP